MTEVLERVVSDRKAAHEAASACYQRAQQLILAGKPVKLTCQEFEFDRTAQANRYYWGVVLKEISEQARVAGQRYTAEAWHELFKRQHLGYEIKKQTVAGRKRKTVIRRLRSTSDLKVKAFAAYLEQVMAFAATDLGVRFSMLEWQEYGG
ncbi:recombination protein NinB [Pelomonas sp. V22]|uniref:recombination protein NinB n=1 Tax=Pelomonas sp. V22 TaxID=2822139 RepID=UPI0024A8469C|nr:recombination protein NinB [Pelomonas sp. V22]MDI4633312.1 recombination protein NinB [Pelomonas sp. V22]